LRADKKIIAHRLASRKNYFIASSPINSKFTALEIQKNGIILDATESFENNADLIFKYLQK